jgi:hypothetical protein
VKLCWLVETPNKAAYNWYCESNCRRAREQCRRLVQSCGYRWKRRLYPIPSEARGPCNSNAFATPLSITLITTTIFLTGAHEACFLFSRDDGHFAPICSRAFPNKSRYRSFEHGNRRHPGACRSGKRSARCRSRLRQANRRPPPGWLDGFLCR